MVAPHERVLDAFAGVGPISIQIAKLQPTASVDAVDMNPEATALFRANIVRNKLRNITIHDGDFAAFAGEAPRRSFSRVVMNLPHRAKEFLPAALPLVAKGGMVHLYAVLPLDKVLPEQGALRALGEKAGHPLTIIRARPLKSYSRNDLYVVFDLRVD
jgi:tRNA (guanine37-N1)-methyltransferase